MSQKFMEYLRLLLHQHSLTWGGGRGRWAENGKVRSPALFVAMFSWMSY